MLHSDLKSKQVFNYLFEKSKKEGIPLDPMKAIKLVYFCHAWYMGYYSTPLIEEPVQAWKYGAVIPSLYHALKIYGSGQIKYPILKNQESHYLDIFLNNDNAFKKEDFISTKSLTDNERQMIDTVWDNYKQLDATQLSNLMHQKGTPWDTIWNNGQCGMGATIPNTLIEKYYHDRIKAVHSER